jgi:uncharacterized protein (DUF4415 family)
MYEVLFVAPLRWSVTPVSVKRPTLNMRVDAEVLEAFKATGAGWQTRINAVLRDAVAHGVTKAR